MNINLYTLSNPITDEVRYVGITSRSLKRRLTQHISEKRLNKRTSWITSLKNKNLLPKIELLSIADENTWASEEKCQKRG